MDRTGSADWHASAAVYASRRIDKQLVDCLKTWFICMGMNAIGWADIDAEQVFDTGTGNYVSHEDLQIPG